MASFVYNAGGEGIGDNTIDWETDVPIKIMLVNTSYASVADQDDDFVDFAGTDPLSGEIETVTNYTGGFAGASRVALTSKTANRDDPTNRVRFDAANLDGPGWSSLGGAANDTIEAAICIKEVTNDAASPVIAFLDTAALTTNGSNVNLTFTVDGVFYLQT